MNTPKTIIKKNLYRISLIFFVFVLFLMVIGSGEQYRFQDEVDYHIIAKNIFAGHGFSMAAGEPTAYRPPGYPALLAVCQYISGSLLIPKILNIFFIIASIFFLSRIANNLSDGAGVYIPFFFIIYPVIAYSSTTLYPQPFGMMLLAGIFLIIYEHHGRLMSAIKSGFLLGALVLTIPGFLLCAPLICSGYFFSYHQTIKWRAIASGICLATCVLVISVWTARNYYHFRSIVPVSSNSGVNLLLGNSEYSTANSGVNADISKFKNHAITMNEIERDAYYREQALDWIYNNPGKAIILYVKKVGNYFNYRLNLATKNQNSLYKNIIMFVSYYAILGIAAAMFFRKRSLSHFERFLWMVYIGNAFIAAIFFTRIRFRIPFDGILILLAAISINGIIKEHLNKKNI